MAEEELKNSFGIENLKQLSSYYIDFCKSLPYYILEDDFIAVHAGLNFGYENPLENKEDLLWTRDWYNNINYDWLQKRKIIHGHTPQTRSEIEEQFEQFEEKQVLNIDCGAFSSRSKIHGLGFLCGFDITNNKLYFQENIDGNCKY
jgi:serine/threonine protein phosphatase 1